MITLLRRARRLLDGLARFYAHQLSIGFPAGPSFGSRISAMDSIVSTGNPKALNTWLARCAAKITGITPVVSLDGIDNKDGTAATFQSLVKRQR
jgi:hypothetical protein